VTGTILGKGGTTQGISASTKQKVNSVEGGGTVVGTVVGAEDGHVHIGGEQQYGDKVEGDKHEVHTQGGTYVEDGVETGGDFVGRDKVVHGDDIGGDKITTGNLSGTGLPLGPMPQPALRKAWAVPI
jgi:hypothetical protein